jgi:uncharacterized repeat protein (TIGR01451 family)
MSIKASLRKRIVAPVFCSVFLVALLCEPFPKGNVITNANAVSAEASANVVSYTAPGAIKPTPKSKSAQSVPPISDGFDFPVGTYGGYGLCPASKGSPSCYWLCRGFQDTVDNVCQKTGYGNHLGEDWNRGSISTPDDFGDTVYAASNGQVIFARTNVPIANSVLIWGKVIIIRHTLPDGTLVESQYAHLKDMNVSEGATVTRGQPIGTIGDGDGNWYSHLHFEIRYPNCPWWGNAGPAWSTNATGWANPANFINSHRSLTCGFAAGQGATGSEMTAFEGANNSAGGQAALGCPTGPVDANGFTSFNGAVGHKQLFTSGQIQYLTNGSNAGQAFAVLAPLDAKWISLGQDSNNPLGYAAGNRAASGLTCYGTRRISQQFEGGSLEYHLTGTRAENIYEVHGAIYTKWAQKGFVQCPLGAPISDVRIAPGSGATGNAGWVSDFEGGHIYWLSVGSEAFEIHGAIDSLYTQMGATASWLGFPLSDEYLSGNPRMDFEGGYITTTDGTNYQAFANGSPSGADLSITMSDSPDPVLLEENLAYTMTVTNNGPNQATNITLTDVLPSNVTFVSAVPSQGAFTGTVTLTCNFGNLGNGASATLALVVKAKAVGTITNTITVRALEYDADAVTAVPTGNNRATEGTVVNPKADLSITKSVSPDPVVIGQNITYTLVAKNLGPSPATGVTVIDPLPAGLTYVSASSTAGTCSEMNGTVTCNIGNLAKNATANINIVATTGAGGTISNIATVSASEADIISGNNTATRSSSVRTLSSLTFTPATVAGCKDSSGKVTLTGPAPASGVTVMLSSGNASATVPQSVSIPSGSTNASFTVSTSSVAASLPVTVTATLSLATKSATLTLRPIGVQSLTLSPNPAVGATSVTGTVQLECVAGPGDVTVALTSSSNSVAQVPSSMTIPAGATSGTFAITTSNVTSTKSSTIKAQASGVSSSVVLQVLPGGSNVNQPPVVNAGADQAILLPSLANLAATVTDDGLPAPPGAVSLSWTQVSGPGKVIFNNPGAAATTASFSLAGVYVLRLTADDGALSAADDVIITANDTVTGMLSGSVATPSGPINLTQSGTSDWAHWGLTAANSFNHKKGVTQQISNFTKIGTGGVNRFLNDPNGYSWTDGTPTLSATNTITGVYLAGLNNGFQITVPADTTDRTLKLYVSVWGSQGRLEATLSDGSAVPFIDTSLTQSSGVNVVGVYTLSYRAASAGKSLTIKWTVGSLSNSFGNVTLQAATLVPGSASSSQASKGLADRSGNLISIRREPEKSAH